MPLAISGDNWRESGERWERETQRLLRAERMLVLAGYGVRLNVQHGSLVIHDGTTHDPQTPLDRIYPRGLHGISRIVLLANSGKLSIDALNWCRQQRIPVTMIDRGGSLVSCVIDETPDAKLRRSQYLAQITSSDERRSARVTLFSSRMAAAACIHSSPVPLS